MRQIASGTSEGPSEIPVERTHLLPLGLCMRKFSDPPERDLCIDLCIPAFDTEKKCSKLRITETDQTNLKYPCKMCLPQTLGLRQGGGTCNLN